MTKAELIQDLKNLIGPSVETGDPGLATWINDAYLSICDEIAAVNPEYFTKAVTASTLAGQQEYDLPDDFEKALMVNIQLDGVWQRALPLPAIKDTGVHARADSAGFNAGTPYYYILGGQIGFEPIPAETTTGNIKLWYVYAPSELAADSDTPALPTRFHHVLKYGAYAAYLDQDDEHVAAENMRRRFDAKVAALVENMTTNQVDESPSVQVTTGSALYYTDDDY